MWSQFLKDKYCQRANPVAKKYDSGDSIVWRYLTKNRNKVESLIKWSIHSGTCSFWWDNWLENDSLANHCDHISSLNNSRLADFLIDGKWNESVIRQHVPPLLIPNILETVFKYKEGKEDTAIWIPDETGKFTISSAWEVIRKKRSHDPINNII